MDLRVHVHESHAWMSSSAALRPSSSLRQAGCCRCRSCPNRRLVQPPLLLLLVGQQRSQQLAALRNRAAHPALCRLCGGVGIPPLPVGSIAECQPTRQAGPRPQRRGVVPGRRPAMGCRRRRRCRRVPGSCRCCPATQVPGLPLQGKSARRRGFSAMCAHLCPAGWMCGCAAAGSPP